MKNTDFDQLFKDGMSAENDQAPSPDLLLVFEARQAVMARKKSTSRVVIRARDFFTAFLPGIRVQHIGFTALLIGGCMLYLSELNYQQNGKRDYSQAGDYASISSHTISVISSTMLTSIPTLRN